MTNQNDVVRVLWEALIVADKDIETLCIGTGYFCSDTRAKIKDALAAAVNIQDAPAQPADMQGEGSGEILRLSLKAMSKHLDKLVQACLDENGNIKAPDKRYIMTARAALPPYCEMSFKKK